MSLFEPLQHHWRSLHKFLSGGYYHAANLQGYAEIILYGDRIGSRTSPLTNYATWREYSPFILGVLNGYGLAGCYPLLLSNYESLERRRQPSTAGYARVFKRSNK